MLSLEPHVVLCAPKYEYSMFTLQKICTIKLVDKYGYKDLLFVDIILVSAAMHPSMTVDKEKCWAMKVGS